GLSAEDQVTFTATVAASGHPGLVLLDSTASSPYLKAFLAAFGPEQVVPVGSFSDGRADLDRRLGVKTAPPISWTQGPPRTLWRELFPKAPRVVVCPAQPRPLFLQAACLAGAVGAPLFVTHGSPGEAEELRRRLGEWGTRQVYAAGKTGSLCQDLGA